MRITTGAAAVVVPCVEAAVEELSPLGRTAMKTTAASTSAPTARAMRLRGDIAQIFPPLTCATARLSSPAEKAPSKRVRTTPLRSITKVHGSEASR